MAVADTSVCNSVFLYAFFVHGLELVVNVIVDWMDDKYVLSFQILKPLLRPRHTERRWRRFKQWFSIYVGVVVNVLRAEGVQVPATMTAEQQRNIWLILTGPDRSAFDPPPPKLAADRNIRSHQWCPYRWGQITSFAAE